MATLFKRHFFIVAPKLCKLWRVIAPQDFIFTSLHSLSYYLPEYQNRIISFRRTYYTAIKTMSGKIW